ncbi:hypothetical protein [Flavobacterium sp.]|uniref:hypothetical protein n=1 Tax=Flavobacterium sp. TaxID=239 RepID=UPI0024875F05|nr:hypothetical protein [Flavobacterium sp.]MDI1318102.1 hypothetical protein [Flavobacterium sp.]
METNNNDSVSNYLENLAKNYLLRSNLNRIDPKRFPMFEKTLIAPDFWKLFLIEYEVLNQKRFIITIESKRFVFTLLYYFLREPNFTNSPCIYKVDKCNNSLDKGLLIVGGFGVGKTTIFRTIVSLIKKLSLNFDGCPVRMHNTADIVEEFESSLNNFKSETITKYSKSFRIFDDVKNERVASNFGKVDLFKEILYQRCESKNFRTLILCNYDSDYPNDMSSAIESFDRYGDRNYDRLFEAFNFIEFKGMSNRM